MLICDKLIAITVYITVNCYVVHQQCLCNVLPDWIEIMVCNRHIKSKIYLLLILNSTSLNQPCTEKHCLLQIFCLFLSIPHTLKRIIKHTVRAYCFD